MIKLPDFRKQFEYENNFYLSCSHTRISKFLAHYELFKMANALPGAIVECGVFKGTSFIRFAAFRDLTGNPFGRKLIGFDTFSSFPPTKFAEDKKYRTRFVQEAGDQSISKPQLLEVLKRKGSNSNIELVAGNILKSVPKYVEDNPHLKISLLNLDTDVYEPARIILEHLWPRIVRGGVLVLDDYGTFPGETQAVDEYFAEQKVQIRKFPFAATPAYIIKE